MTARPDVLIIGGGVIGCAAAYYLTRNGVAVTVIDKGAVGHGCSYGNAGWLVPAHAMPLPAPGAVRSAAKWIMRPDSPLYIKPRCSPAMALWLLRFLRSSNKGSFERGIPPLVGLAQRSLELTEAFVADHGNDGLDFRMNGLTYVCKSRAGLDHSLHELDLVRKLGYDGEVLDAEALVHREPIIRGPVAGGVFYPGQGQIEPLPFVKSLAAQAAALGATFLPGTEVFEFEIDGRRIRSVHTTQGSIEADEIVLAAGAWTRDISKKIGVEAPIEAGKGYALIYDQPEQMPTAPLLLVEGRVAITPRNGSIRCAGTMELGGMNDSITPRRVRAIARTTTEYMDLCTETRSPVEVWRGMRPCTPDGLPMIGRSSRYQNLILAAGHAMLGLMSSTGTGEIIASLLAGQPPRLDLGAFRPDRFG